MDMVKKFGELMVIGFGNDNIEGQRNVGGIG